MRKLPIRTKTSREKLPVYLFVLVNFEKINVKKKYDVIHMKLFPSV